MSKNIFSQSSLIRFLAASAIFAGSALFSTAYAQDADATKTAAPKEVAEEVITGPKLTTQWHGDWLLECYDPAIQSVNCQIKQRVVQQESEQNILVISIAYDPAEKKNIIQYVLPLDFLITPGVSIEVGDYQTTIGVNRCSAQGCFSEGTTEDAFIDKMKATTDGGRAVILTRTGKKIGIGFSAKGFTAAYKQMVMENEKLAKTAKKEEVKK